MHETATPVHSTTSAQALILPRPGARFDTPTEPTEQPVLHVGWARHLDEVRAAQRLRYHVFVEEMGAKIKARMPGHDIDLFDDYCEHLIVREQHSQRVVGTYRLLTPVQAKRLGYTYTETEFDLVRLRSLREHMVEIGRSCVHPDFRNGSVMAILIGSAFSWADIFFYALGSIASLWISTHWIKETP